MIMNSITMNRINHLLLMFCIILLQGEVMAFQQPHIKTNTKQHATIIHTRNSVVALSLVSTNNDTEGAVQKQMTNMFLSSAFGMCLVSLIATPQLANAIEQADINMGIRNTGTALMIAADDTETTTSKLSGMSITNYAKQVFGSPLVGSTPGISTNKPIQIDPKYTTREERNRAYDEAFQQDARDRDAYYGQMAMKKRQESEQSISTYREQLGLDGEGDTRMRVGEERVEGLASLRDLKADYALKQQENGSSSVSSSTE